MAASFLPFIGLHFDRSSTRAFVAGNVLASAIGTFFGNPWTFLFICIGLPIGIMAFTAKGHGDQFPALNLQQLADVMTIFIKFFTFQAVSLATVGGTFCCILGTTIGTLLAVLSGLLHLCCVIIRLNGGERIGQNGWQRI